MESWSTSRQMIFQSADANTFSTDRSSVTSCARRTYIERACLTGGYRFMTDVRWCTSSLVDPEHTDRSIVCQCIDHDESSRVCLCESDGSCLLCIFDAVDDQGPVVLEYPKHFNDPTIPPDFDVVFRIFSTAKIDWPSFTMSVSSTSGGTRTFGVGDITRIGITTAITEIRLTPAIATLVGDTVNVRVFMRDIYRREVTLNW